MQLIETLMAWLLGILAVSVTLAVVARVGTWGLSGWLGHRLDAERVRATRLQAQAQVEAAQAKERATVDAARVQAEAQVVIARDKAWAQVQMQTAMYELRARTELAKLAVQAPPPPSAPTLITVSPEPIEPTAPTPSLPEIVAWRDVAEHVRPGYFAYGVLASGQLVQKPVTSAYHTLLHGETRSGKTTAIHSLLVQAHVLAQVAAVRCYLTDVKRELGAAWGRSPLLAAPVQNDAAGAAELITELVHGADGVLARYKQFEGLGHARNVICANLRDYERLSPGGARERPPLVFVVIDELNALLEIARKTDDLQRSLTVLLQTGAAAGFYVIAGAQYLNAKVLGRDATQQFVSRAHFGTYDPTALRMLFNHSPEHAEDVTIPPGRGYIRVQGQPAVLPFQGVYCDETTILTVQRQIRPATTTGLHVLPISLDAYRRKASTPGERPIGHVEGVADVEVEAKLPSACLEGTSSASLCGTSTSVCPEIDGEKAAKVAYLRGTEGGKKRKSEIIAAVWGVTGGRKFTAASVEYEAIVAMLDQVAA